MPATKKGRRGRPPQIQTIEEDKAVDDKWSKVRVRVRVRVRVKVRVKVKVRVRVTVRCVNR